ncbi:MAG: hypothetical protein Q8Q44_26080, partial [Nocardioides sp.]|nr:hypothetical protein [Nocardioides sp.]
SDAPGDALAPSVEVGELAAAATPRVPATAPPTQSLAGDPVDFDARNLLDGDRATAWRMPGDGTGEEIVLELGEEAVVTSVGLVNGYAKTDIDQAGNPVRWYRHNRTIEQVTWVFDDETEVVQRLRTTQRMQTIDVDQARTSSVRLRLDAVSAPGPTERARDFTPISEITITGASAGSD